MTELEDKMNLAIDEANFNFLELEGFKSKPRLALLAGVAIGYKLGLKHVESIITPEPDRAYAASCSGCVGAYKSDDTCYICGLWPPCCSH